MIRSIRYVLLKLKKFLKRIVIEDNSAHSIAMGAAVGVFVGILPTFGFQMIPALAISIKLRINKLTAMTGVWVTNPFTVIPIYLFNYWVGSLILPSWYVTDIQEINTFLKEVSWANFLKLGSSTIVTFTIGSLIVASLSGVAVYFLLRPLIERHHFTLALRRRQRRRPPSR